MWKHTICRNNKWFRVSSVGHEETFRSKVVVEAEDEEMEDPAARVNINVGKM